MSLDYLNKVIREESRKTKTWNKIGKLSNKIIIYLKTKWVKGKQKTQTKHFYLIESGGVNLIIESCVGLARIPLCFNFKHISYAVTGDKALLFSSTALNKPFPRTSFMNWGNSCWTLRNWCLSSSPRIADLLKQKHHNSSNS